MGLKVGLLGVGPVGDRIVRVLRERKFPIDGELIVMATSEREETLAGETFQVHQIAADLFKGMWSSLRGRKVLKAPVFNGEK